MNTVFAEFEEAFNNAQGHATVRCNKHIRPLATVYASRKYCSLRNMQCLTELDRTSWVPTGGSIFFFLMEQPS